MEQSIPSGASWDGLKPVDEQEELPTAPFPERAATSAVSRKVRRSRRLRPADLRSRAHAWPEEDWATTDPEAGLPRRPKLPLARTLKLFRAEGHTQAAAAAAVAAAASSAARAAAVAASAAAASTRLHRISS